jgi:hypothetical protein
MVSSRDETMDRPRASETAATHCILFSEPGLGRAAGAFEHRRQATR